MSIIATPKKSALYDVGPSSVPEEIRNLRMSAFDFHVSMGQFVIHKHRWNERDVQQGLAQKCPFHDNVYEQDAYDPYCLGTGFVGGFSDGVAVPVTIGDTQEDVFRPNEQGVLIHERHPGLTAPWTPEMGDDDLIIVAEFEGNSMDIRELGDRYILRQVRPVTLRGPKLSGGNTLHMKPFKVNQEAMIDLLPYGHPFYNVPINFNYDSVPISGTSIEYSARIIGQEAKATSSYTQTVHITGAGNTSSRSQSVRVTGEGGGTHFHF